MLFNGCNSLVYIIGISNWDTFKVKNISGMFQNCISLEYIPDLSKWKTDKVENMSHLFCGCENLKEFPNINNWNIKNVKDISHFANNVPIDNILISNLSRENVRDKYGKFEIEPDYIFKNL